MSLIQQISDARMHHRKNRDFPASKLHAISLTTLYGEAQIIGKNNNRETTDDEVVKVIQRFIKGLNDISKYRDLTHEEKGERTLYQTFLPTLISDNDIKAFAQNYITTIGECNMKHMGIIMKGLKEQYPGQVDGKSASLIIKQELTKGK